MLLDSLLGTRSCSRHVGYNQQIKEADDPIAWKAYMLAEGDKQYTSYNKLYRTLEDRSAEGKSRVGSSYCLVALPRCQCAECFTRMISFN